RAQAWRFSRVDTSAVRYMAAELASLRRRQPFRSSAWPQCPSGGRGNPEPSLKYLIANIAQGERQKHIRLGGCYGRQNTQGQRCVEEATHAESILCDPSGGDGAAVYRVI